ncbi:TFIIH complex subunit tfb5 [Elasticomyces elasticus]|nr:TFIIH complex subunit tfb5 [Elasticomyces elasticus]
MKIDAEQGHDIVIEDIDDDHVLIKSSQHEQLKVSLQKKEQSSSQKNRTRSENSVAMAELKLVRGRADGPNIPSKIRQLDKPSHPEVTSKI